MDDLEYAGFWIRTGAALIDSLLLLLIIGPVLTFIYGADYWFDDSAIQGSWDVLINYLLPAVAVVIFWVYRSATPGKMALKLTIVDARTGGRPSTSQCIGQYLGYYIAVIPLLLGILWVGFDKRKQGWHDKMVGTVVIRNDASEPVRFDNVV